MNIDTISQVIWKVFFPPSYLPFREMLKGEIEALFPGMTTGPQQQDRTVSSYFWGFGVYLSYVDYYLGDVHIFPSEVVFRPGLTIFEVQSFDLNDPDSIPNLLQAIQAVLDYRAAGV
jgi:hypothetical protein